MKEKLIRFKQNFLTLPLSTRRLLSLGFVLAFTLALPLFVWAILSGNYDIRERAASGEPTPTPTSSPSPINDCNKRCNKNYNDPGGNPLLKCPPNLTCYDTSLKGKVGQSRFCRNPKCPTETNCLCKPSPTAIPIPTSTPRPTPVAGCNKSCNYSINPPVKCLSNLTCYIGTGGGFSGQTGYCRNPKCTTSTNCLCTPTPFPKPIP